MTPSFYHCHYDSGKEVHGTDGQIGIEAMFCTHLTLESSCLHDETKASGETSRRLTKQWTVQWTTTQSL